MIYKMVPTCPDCSLGTRWAGADAVLCHHCSDVRHTTLQHCEITCLAEP